MILIRCRYRWHSQQGRRALVFAGRTAGRRARGIAVAIQRAAGLASHATALRPCSGLAARTFLATGTAELAVVDARFVILGSSSVHRGAEFGGQTTPISSSPRVSVKPRGPQGISRAFHKQIFGSRSSHESRCSAA